MFQATALSRELRAIDLRHARGFAGKTLVLGGDGRYYNREAIQITLSIAAANGFGRIVDRPGRNAVDARGLSADPLNRRLRRHHPVGEPQSRRPARRFRHQIQYRRRRPGAGEDHRRDLRAHQAIAEYKIARHTRRRSRPTRDVKVGDATIEIVDPVENYAKLMRKLFDFDAIRALFACGFRMRFDAMHAITGPYAKAIFEDELGRPPAVVNGTPLEDFGGHHPDPNLVYAKELYDLMMAPAGPDFGAASDGDGDRNLIIGRGQFITPSDSLAILAANAHLRPATPGPAGVARSMPTSAAADRVAAKLGIGRLRDADRLEVLRQPARRRHATLCGEESFGTGSNHVREKDGLWAVLFWLNILAARMLGRRPCARTLARLRPPLLHPPRLRGGRPLAGNALMEALRAPLPRCPASRLARKGPGGRRFRLSRSGGRIGREGSGRAGLFAGGSRSSTGFLAPARSARRSASISRNTSRPPGSR